MSREKMSELQDSSLLLLDEYRKSPQPSAGASRPKRCYTSPEGEIYFKFDMTNNEVCAELFSYHIAACFNISAAKTVLAKSAGKIGIASFDIGEYEEPDDTDSYSIIDFVHIPGFIEMCLFDYLIMNEDRHAGNWGIVNGTVAPLFDHNYCFGGDTVIYNNHNFMINVTSPFNVRTQYEQKHDAILAYLAENNRESVTAFMAKAAVSAEIKNTLWQKYFPEDCARLNKMLTERIEYMKRKAGEYSAG